LPDDIIERILSEATRASPEVRSKSVYVDDVIGCSDRTLTFVNLLLTCKSVSALMMEIEADRPVLAHLRDTTASYIAKAATTTMQNVLYDNFIVSVKVRTGTHWLVYVGQDAIYDEDAERAVVAHCWFMTPFGKFSFPSKDIDALLVIPKLFMDVLVATKRFEKRCAEISVIRESIQTKYHKWHEDVTDTDGYIYRTMTSGYFDHDPVPVESVYVDYGNAYRNASGLCEDSIGFCNDSLFQLYNRISCDTVLFKGGSSKGQWVASGGVVTTADGVSRVVYKSGATGEQRVRRVRVRNGRRAVVYESF
jgi:hypothetical protein